MIAKPVAGNYFQTSVQTIPDSLQRKGMMKYHGNNDQPIIESETPRYVNPGVYANKQDEERQCKANGGDDDHRIAVSFRVDIVRFGPRSDDFGRWKSHYPLYLIRPHPQRPKSHSFRMCVGTSHGGSMRRRRELNLKLENRYVRSVQEQEQIKINKPIVT